MLQAKRDDESTTKKEITELIPELTELLRNLEQERLKPGYRYEVDCRVDSRGSTRPSSLARQWIKDKLGLLTRSKPSKIPHASRIKVNIREGFLIVRRIS